MIGIIRSLISSVTVPLVMLAVIGAFMLSISTPQGVNAAACTANFFGLPAWYDGLTDGSCNIVSPEQVGGLTTFVWKIVLNILEAFLIVVGYASVIMIIVGGYKYMVATGSADKIKGAKDTIRNAIVGLVIALASVAIVNMVAGAL